MLTAQQIPPIALSTATTHTVPTRSNIHYGLIEILARADGVHQAHLPHAAVCNQLTDAHVGLVQRHLELPDEQKGKAAQDEPVSPPRESIANARAENQKVEQ